MEMHCKERFVIRTNSGLQEVLPKDCVFFPPRPEVSRVVDRYLVHLSNCELRNLLAYARRHAEEEVCSSGHRSTEVPHFHQDFPQKRRRLRLIDQFRRGRGTGNCNPLLRDTLPPIEAVEIQIDQQHWAASGTFTGHLIHLSPELRVSIDRTSLNRSAATLDDLRQCREAPCIQPVHRGYCLQTGPPGRPWRRAIPTHIPIRCCGIGGVFSRRG